MSEKKTAIVTGGSRGIGRAICIDLAGRDYYVVVNYRSNDEAAEETLALMRSAGGEGELCRFDVADREEAEARLESLLDRLESVEVLVNNAGEC